MKPKEKKLDNIQLKVPKPCKEDWDQMQPAEQNRFCSRCEKVVIDFTALTDQQVAALIAANPGKQFCGRFKKEQLNRRISPVSPKPQAYAATEQQVPGTFLFTLKAPVPAVQQHPLKPAGDSPAAHSGFFFHFLTFFK